MLAWAEKLLYLGIVIFVLGILLRIIGFSDAKGFLQPPLSHGITPGALLDAGTAFAIFAASIALVDMAKRR
ncbi:MAG: hypothetical protein KJ050_11600 [Candidatus Omnitrophica bacterium]|jgi:hypothetical protein|nr:hypothetical protein [bacterium]MBK7494268.1 hypothetical protein [Candidatus Omnitrophota bacterium]MCE7909154.1 hypothetical protein [Candidatus Omnitrophica bacterium COP1]MBV6482900.1 hypothetical protein [bacterium]MBW7937591.1 hypothetical protein [Candidatus Omnitrophota bacterium]